MNMNSNDKSALRDNARAVNLCTAVIIDFPSDLANLIIDDATAAAIADHGPQTFYISREKVWEEAYGRCGKAFRNGLNGESWDHAYDGAKRGLDEQFAAARKAPDDNVHEIRPGVRSDNGQQQHRAEGGQQRKPEGDPAEGGAKPRKLMFITGNELRDMPKKTPWFFVEGVVQGRKVNLLMGEDGSGKSFLMLLLAIIAATGGDWLGFKVKHGPVVFLTAEEEVEEVWERIEAIERMLGRGPLDLKDFYLVILDDDDSDDGLVLGGPTGEKGKIQMTTLWRTLLRGVEEIKPVASMLDPLVEIFDGDEMVRLQSRQFMSPIRKAARKHDMAVYVSGHPSKTSAKDKTGTAGTTGWSATTRGRQFYEIVYDDDNNDTGERRFHVKKVTRGKAVPVIDIKLNADGVPVLKDAPKVEAGEVAGSLNAVLAKIERDKQEFMDAVEKKAAIGVFLSASPKSPKGYAPKALEEGGRGKDRVRRIKAKEQIMNDLLDERRIVSEQYGPPSADKWRLKVVSRTIPDVSEEENFGNEDEG
jgi:RecA-family ATPase